MNSLEERVNASRCEDSCRPISTSFPRFGNGVPFPTDFFPYGLVNNPSTLPPLQPTAGNTDEPPPGDGAKNTKRGTGKGGRTAHRALTLFAWPRILLMVMVMLSSAAVAHWAYLYQSLEIATAGLDQTRSELLRAESENKAGQRWRRQFERENQNRFEVLRKEIVARLVRENQRDRLRQKKLVAALSSKVAKAQREQSSFKRVFSAARDSILFIRTEFKVQFLQTGETKTFTSFGTGFFISPFGEAMTAKHVLYPWLYHRKLKAMEKLGVAKVLADTLELTMWLTDSQVRGKKGDPASFYEENAYRLDGERKDIRILYTADPEVKTEQIMSPVGPVEIEIPELGKGDFVIFQIMDFSRRFKFVPLDPSGHNTTALDEVMAIGYPLARLQEGRAIPQASRGGVRRVGPSIMELDSPLHSGNSGGPILDKRGRVVGLASAVLDSPVYGVAVRAVDLSAAWMQVRETVRMDQRRLKGIGCYSGAVDGIPGRQTLQARHCRGRLFAAAL